MWLKSLDGGSEASQIQRRAIRERKSVRWLHQAPSLLRRPKPNSYTTAHSGAYKARCAAPVTVVERVRDRRGRNRLAQSKTDSAAQIGLR